MRVWIISQFTESIDENTSNRYTYIFKSLKKLGYEIKFVTSDFNHVTKQSKKIKHTDVIKIKEPGYKSNVSISRLYSHIIYANNAYILLKREVQENDVILLALPSNLLGYRLAKLKKVINFKLIVDIHDLWPESLISLMPKMLKSFGSPLWWGWKACRISTVKQCDYLLAESNEYEILNKKYLRDNVESDTILLGAEVSLINKIPASKFDNNDKFRVVFAGNLGVNYDIDTTLNMIVKYSNELQEQGIEIYFFGNGEKENLVKEYAGKYSHIIKCLDRVGYNEYIAMLKAFDVGLNSFQSNSAVRYSYKSVDYLVSNLPILNNLKGEFAKDIEDYKIGKNYVAGDINSLYLNLMNLKNEINKEPNEYAKNVELYVKLKLDRENIYKPLFNYFSESFKQGE